MTGQTITAEWPKNPKLVKGLRLAAAGWRRVIYASDCDTCDELICPLCLDHYADCPCPHPGQDNEFEYQTVDGVEYARRL